MPTAKPRVQVTLKPSQFHLLRRLSKLQSRSMSAVLSELFETIEPVLERVAVVLQAAVQAQASALDGLRTATDAAQAELEPMLATVMGQLDLLVDTAAAGGAGGPREAGVARPLHPAVTPGDPPALTGGSGDVNDRGAVVCASESTSKPARKVSKGARRKPVKIARRASPLRSGRRPKNQPRRAKP